MLRKYKNSLLFLFMGMISLFFISGFIVKADDFDLLQDIKITGYTQDVGLPAYIDSSKISLTVTLKSAEKISSMAAIYDVAGSPKTLNLTKGENNTFNYVPSANDSLPVGEYHLKQLDLINNDQQVIHVTDSALFSNADFMLRQVSDSNLVKEIYLSSKEPVTGSILKFKIKLDDRLRGGGLTLNYPIESYANLYVKLPYNRNTGYNEGSLKILDIFGLTKQSNLKFPLQNIIVDNSYNQIYLDNLADYPDNATFVLPSFGGSVISNSQITPKAATYGDVVQISLIPHVKDEFSVINLYYKNINESTPRKVSLRYNNLTQKYMGTLNIDSKIPSGIQALTKMEFISDDQTWIFDYHYSDVLKQMNITVNEDTKAPTAPKVNKIGNNDTVITGTAEPKSTVIAYLGDDETDDSNEIAKGQADALGKYKLYINHLSVGDVVRVYAKDFAENQSVPAKTTVIDNEPPTISGIKNQTLRVDEEFDPMEGITAFDPTDGDLTDQIKVTGSIKTSRVGNYRLTYTVKDNSGNRTSVDRTIVIQPQLKTLMFDSQGGSYVESISVPAGTKVKAPTDPTRIGYTFAGWYTDADYTKSYVFNQPVNDTIVLYAKWLPLAPDADNYVVMYRLYNPYSGEHFYTSNLSERTNIIKYGWKDEGVAWVAPTEGDDVYRLYNPNSGDHHYTLSKVERDYLVRIGWRYEGVGWKSDPDKRVPIYRLYNKNQKKAGSHHYTISKEEQEQLSKIGWSAEGIGWYAIS